MAYIEQAIEKALEEHERSTAVLQQQLDAARIRIRSTDSELVAVLAGHQAPTFFLLVIRITT